MTNNNISFPTSVLKTKNSRVGNSQKFLERNYHNNLKTDYTEIIGEICKNFQYDRNSQSYWSEPELSLLYGTPLYEQSSHSQKLVLNHLYWYTAYKIVADSESEATRYNLITAGSFVYKSNDYQSLADMLEHETEQEYIHIRAFYKVGYQVYKNIIEKHKNSKNSRTLSHNFYFDESKNSKKLTRFLSKLNENSSERLEFKQAYEDNIYVKQLNESKKVICTPTHGFFHTLTGNFPDSVRQLFSSSWGSSPFLGCSFYLSRYMANLFLKNFEHKISKYYTKLQKQNEFIPSPTSISRYHFLDEAFHTTTSLKLGRDFYKELPKPSEYEKFFTNALIYAIQLLNFGTLSGIAPNRFVPDTYMMPLIYNLLRSTVFDMTVKETLYWMEKCFSCEHDGFYTNKKYHGQLYSELCRLTDHLDYLWPSNKTMQLVNLGGSIGKAIENNAESFKQFSYHVKSLEAA